MLAPGAVGQTTAGNMFGTYVTCWASQSDCTNGGDGCSNGFFGIGATSCVSGTTYGINPCSAAAYPYYCAAGLPNAPPPHSPPPSPPSPPLPPSPPPATLTGHIFGAPVTCWASQSDCTNGGDGCSDGFFGIGETSCVSGTTYGVNPCSAFPTYA